MKKFYAFAAAAVMAVSAFAQNGADLYITGAGAFENGEWKPEAPGVFTYADGKYTFEIEKLGEFKISTVTGEGAEDAWAAFNGGALTCSYGSEVGVAVELTQGDANIVPPIADAPYTITVAGDLSTITLTTDAEKPTTAPVLYLRGGMNEWGSPDEWKLTPENDVPENTVWTFTCAEGQSIEPFVDFKIATAGWSAPNLGAGEDPITLLDTDTPVFNGSNTNLQVEEEWNGVLYLNLDIDGEAYVWFSNDKTATPDWYTAVKGVAVDENAPAVYYNLQGIRVANPENGMFIQVKGNKVSKVVR